MGALNVEPTALPGDLFKARGDASLIVRSRAPLRMSFGGGGTDVAPYLEEKGGAVISTTIDKYAYCSLKPGNGGGVTIKSLDYDAVADFDDNGSLPYTGKLDLQKAVINRFHLNHGVEMMVHCDAPPGSGLGSSSAMAVAMVGAAKRMMGESIDRQDVAETAYLVERNEAGIRGGRQDQYAAAFGGFNFMEFSKVGTAVTPLRLPQGLLDEMQYRLMLVYTGKLRVSANIIQDQVAGYQAQREQVVNALDQTKELAYQMRSVLQRGDLEEFGRLLNQAWMLKRQFTPKVSDHEIDSMYDAAVRNGAMGGKLLGAGGGGFMLLYCDYTKRHMLAKEVMRLGGTIVPFRFENTGLRVWTTLSGGVEDGEVC